MLEHHEHYEDLILRQATGDHLSDLERRRLDDHLKTCAVCQQLHTEWTTIAAATRLHAAEQASTLPPLPALPDRSPGLISTNNHKPTHEANLMTTSILTAPRPDPTYRKPNRSIFDMPRWLTAAAALIAVIGAVVTFALNGNDDDPNMLASTSIAQEPTATPAENDERQIWVVVPAVDVATGEILQRDNCCKTPVCRSALRQKTCSPPH